MSNTIGSQNTAVGTGALRFNTTGNDNTIVASAAGTAVQTASHVICIGAGVAGFDVDAAVLSAVFGDLL